MKKLQVIYLGILGFVFTFFSSPRTLGQGLGGSHQVLTESSSFKNLGPWVSRLFSGSNGIRNGVFSDPKLVTTLLESLKLDPSKNVLSLISHQLSESAFLETQRFQHQFMGIEVIGSGVTSIQGHGRDIPTLRKRIAIFDLDVRQKIDPELAVSVANSYLSSLEQGENGENREVRLTQTPHLKILPSFKNNSAELIYWIEAEEHQLIINAHTGEVIADIPTVLPVAPVQVFSAENLGLEIFPHPQGCIVKDLRTNNRQIVDSFTCSRLGQSQCQVILDSMPVRLNPAQCKRTVSFGQISTTADRSSRQAAANSMAVLNYYQSRHQRNSFDNRGSETLNIVRAGSRFNNAYWNTTKDQMVYGDGDGITFGDFTLALDISGHEWTHGVTAKTANLLYMGESGALNEAFSDFFGELIENKGDWVLGKSIYLNPNAQGMRDLARPGNIKSHLGKRYPAHISEIQPIRRSCGATNDQCYVHINSTIPGHAFYLIQSSIGQARAERLLYITLTQFLSAMEDFESTAEATLQVCHHLFDRQICAQVEQSFERVGL